MYNVLPRVPWPNMALLAPVRDNDKLHTERGVNCGSCAENVRELKLFCFESDIFTSVRSRCTFSARPH